MELGGRRFRWLALTVLLWAPLVGAQGIDRVDINARPSDADIVVRFVHKIIYQRHAPSSDGRLLRVFLKPIDASQYESELMQQTLRGPRVDGLPEVEVVYPELNNGMLVSFSRRTAFAVKPGADGQSIIITVPRSPPVKPPEPATAPASPPRVSASSQAMAAEQPYVLGADALDSIAVVKGVKEAEITIRFAGKLTYKRHAPQGEGDAFRVFLRYGEPGFDANSLTQQTLRIQDAPDLPGVAVTYPELNDGMLVKFERSTPYSVRPGADGQSIVIVVPLTGTSLPQQPQVAATPAPAVSIPPPVPTPPPVPPAPSSAIAVAAAPASAPAPATAAAVVTVAPAAPPPRPSPAIAPTAQTAAAPEAVTTADPDTEAAARRFMGEARQALAGKDGVTAINRLNRVLGMQRNSETEPAQALMGEVREANGELAKAVAEYKLYLKLFPSGPAAQRILERLAALPKDAATTLSSTAKALPKEPGPAEWTVYGSVSAYYYAGKSQIETLTPPPPGQLTFNQATLSLVDQNSLITSTNLNARRRDAVSDTRIVFRDTDNRNYLRPDRSYNRLYSAYVDHADRQAGYYLRGGRQNPNGVGVLDRFDGVQAGYNLSPSWRVNAAYGDAAEFNSPFKKNFYGVAVDLLPDLGKPGLSLYHLRQTLDGLPNRNALGAEARYFDSTATAYGILDYDTLYRGVNIALLQGNYLGEGGANYFIVLDHRRAPSFGLTNALLGAPGLSLADLVAAQGMGTVRQQAAALTAMSDMFSIGMTRPLSERWQAGVDYRLSQISSTSPVDAVIPLPVIGTCIGTIDPVNNTCIINTASQQGSGKNHVLTLQAIGSNLFFPNAVGVASLSLIKAPSYSGQAVALSYVVPIGDAWRFDSNIRYYIQSGGNGDRQSRFAPSFKLSWQWQNRIFLEGEAGREASYSSYALQSDHTLRSYIYLGLRMETR